MPHRPEAHHAPLREAERLPGGSDLEPRPGSIKTGEEEAQQVLGVVGECVCCTVGDGGSQQTMAFGLWWNFLFFVFLFFCGFFVARWCLRLFSKKKIAVTENCFGTVETKARR